MKRFIAIATLLCTGCLLHAQPLTGNWEGALAVNEMELPVIFHLSKDSSGKWSGTMDSPKQMAFGLKCSSIITTGDSVIIEMKSFGGRYAGILTTDKKRIDGNWSQGGQSLPLHLTKTGDQVSVQALKRPQTPKPPFNYFADSVTYSNADGSITFGATITRPMNKMMKKYPAVILITGSGQQDRDETLFKHRPFAVIADYLTRQGIVVLRVDDRGKGKTTGNFRTSTTLDFANDVEAGIDYLKSRNDIDPDRIGLIGHSEGGIIAPMVAAKRQEVSFIVLLAGPGIPVTQLMEQQNADILASGGMPQQDVDQYITLYRTLTQTILQETDTSRIGAKAMAAFISWQQKTPAITVQQTTGVTDEKSRDEFVGSFIAELRNPWYRYFLHINPADHLRRLKCAVLALNGEKDIQVAAKPNLEAIRSIMVEKMVKTFKVQSLPGLNHLFQHCNTCTTAEYGMLEETFSTEALQIMGDWIQQVVKK